MNDPEWLALVRQLMGEIISAAEAQQLKDAYAARLAAIEVDQFTPEQYFAVVKRDGGIEYKMAMNG